MDLRVPRPRATRVEIPGGLVRLNHRRSSRQDSTPARPEIRRSSATNRAAASAGTRHSRFEDRKSTRLNSSHLVISYAVFCLKKKKKNNTHRISAHNV